MPNLQVLILTGCTSLAHVDESIEVLSRLLELHLTNCKSLVSLPNGFFHLTSLQYLELNFCLKLENPFEKISDAGCLMEFIKKSTFTSSIVYKAMMSHFQIFNRRHKQWSKLLLHGLRSLVCLRLGFGNLRELPDAIGWMQSLKLLDLKGNKFVTLPSTINKLSRLQYLNLGNCKKPKSFGVYLTSH